MVVPNDAKNARHLFQKLTLPERRTRGVIRGREGVIHFLLRCITQQSGMRLLERSPKEGKIRAKRVRSQDRLGELPLLC